MPGLLAGQLVLLLLLVGLLATGCTPPWENHPDDGLSSCEPVEVGDSGDCVWGVQNALYARGFLPTVDGDFGPGTVAALRQFQSSRSLAVDGVAGPQTLQELESSLHDRLGSFVYRFDRQTTRKISSVLGGEDALGKQLGTSVACHTVKQPLASTVCEFLVPFGVDKVGGAARNAAQKNACLKVDLRHVPIRLSTDGGPQCT